MSKWDDQFDFDDLDSKPTKAKQNKKNNKRTDQFFELDEQTPSKALKLPLINSKTNLSNNKNKNQKKSTNLYDDYEEISEDVEETKSPVAKDRKKQKQQALAQQELDYLEQTKPKKQPQKNLKNNSKVNDQEQYYQEVQQLPSPSKDQQKATKDLKEKVQKKQENEQNYQQNFDDYGEELLEKTKQEVKADIPKKSVTTVNLKSKDKSFTDQNAVEDKKYSISTNKVFTNKQPKINQPPIPKPPQKENKVDKSTIQKKTIQAKAPAHGLSQPPKQLSRSNSRKSLKSNDSKSNIGYSRVSKNNVTVFPPNKHITLVEKSFPDQDQKLSSMNIDKLSKMNQQIREMIRKFNDELNQLINKNMVLLKQKPSQKQRTTDDKIRLLQQQLKSGTTAIEVVQNQYDRLKDRQGELKEEQYQLIIQKKIQDCKQQAKETLKVIAKLKLEMNNDGNKLSKQQIQKKNAQQLHQLKIMLVQAKKEEEKYDAKLEKIQKMVEELEGKNNDKQYELSGQIDQAKEKGIVLGIKEETRKKYEELKFKTLSTENHRKCMQGLFKSKCETIVHQNQQIKITIKSIESQITNLAHSVQQQQEETVKIIKKAKQNTKNSPAFAQNLDKLLKSIQQSQNINLFQIRSEGNKSQASERPLKTSMYQNMTKQKPIRNNSSKKEQTAPKPQPQPHPDQINLMKPNFLKKKEKNPESHQKQDSKTQRTSQRIWREQEELKKKEEQKRKEQQRIKEEQAKNQEIKKAAAAAAALQEEKKKPFNLKKNRMNQDKSIQQTPQSKPEQKEQIILSNDKNQQKQQEKSSIGPRMMRFNKKQRNNNDNSKNEISVEPAKDQLKITKQQTIKQAVEPLSKPAQTQEAIFMPKRFNMRNKIEKKEQAYVPTLQKQVEEKKEEKKEYNPNFSLKDEPPKVTIEGSKVQNEKKLQAPEQKPKFTLRLRDRQKKENNEAEYMPSRTTQVIEEKLPKNHFNSIPESKKEEKIGLATNIKNETSSYQPTIQGKTEKSNHLSQQIQTKQPTIAIKDHIHNPYATKPQVQAVINRQKEANPVQINNPYAQKQDMPKRERQGPVRKTKVQTKQPKQKFNIYEQAEDITQPVTQPAVIPAAQPVVQKPSNQVSLAKTNELDLNAMLGIKKKDKTNDLDDLLGEIKVEKKKNLKKNNDFFNDLEL